MTLYDNQARVLYCYSIMDEDLAFDWARTSRTWDNILKELVCTLEANTELI